LSGPFFYFKIKDSPLPRTNSTFLTALLSVLRFFPPDSRFHRKLADGLSAQTFLLHLTPKPSLHWHLIFFTELFDPFPFNRLQKWLIPLPREILVVPPPVLLPIESSDPLFFRFSPAVALKAVRSFTETPFPLVIVVQFPLR